ncbi:extracellular solute-binding protein [Bogoriella caseilytica]|uniref:Carbohydrate ABC transporter substrate-binding protein (CUT1 family) n=1 Tax=Bogoriella caseilytica TaxID=56055 RepID=A0A3N2BCV1_9MICO|nr:extracellular solute-binding protein [Bogoriella caseilytica]ROR73068.1 carbohydrate ABC transporter substrate-binding protein (CUT1 family) [Bogoriella caseilytica]
MRSTRMGAAGGIASAAAVALVLAACGGGGSDDVDTDEVEETQNTHAMEDFEVGTTFVATGDEPLNISVLYRDHPNYPLDEDWLFFTYLEEHHNVTFTNQIVPLSDWDEGRSLAIAGGNIPDIVPTSQPGDEGQFVGSGVLLPISQYLDFMPHLQEKIEAWDLQEELDQQLQLDGNFYMLPGLYEVPNPEYTVAIRADLFEESGFTEDPETWDEFADMMETVMNDHDLDYAWSDRWSGGGPMEASMSMMSAGFGTAAGWNYGDGLHYDHDAGEYVYAGAMDEYRDLVGYLHDLVERGILDPESVTQDDDTAIGKFTNGQSAVIGTNTQEILTYRDSFDGDEDVQLIRVPAGPAGDVSSETRTFFGAMFSADLADSDQLVATLQFWDWLYYSDEGMEFAKWGVEGETYTREGDERVLADHIDINNLNPGADSVLNTDYGFHNGVWMPTHGASAELLTSMFRDEVTEFVEAMGEKEIIEPGPPYPYDEAEQETQSLTANTLNDHVQQNTTRFILGQRSLDEWDQYVTELEGYGMENYVNTANEAATRDFDEEAFDD